VTLVEFLYPIRKGKQRDLVLATLFFHTQFKGANGMTGTEIKTALTSAKVPNAKKMNVNDVINKSSPYVHSPRGKENGAFLFELTDTGEKHVRELLDVPAPDLGIQQDVSTLRALSDKISDETVKGFIDEAIVCLRADALRAALVFLWSGAIRTLHEEALKQKEATINDAIQKHAPKARTVKKVEDFAWINDRTFLEACPDMGVLDKGEKDTLVDALNLRNRCGHPTKYKPGVQKARSFIEDVVGIVFA
jgi:hypothetical protein